MNIVSTIRSGAVRAGTRVRSGSLALWARYRGLRRRWQIAIAAALAALLIALFMLLGGGGAPATKNSLRTVTLESVGALSGTGDSVSVVGTVRSVSEADILAQSGGTVRRVHTRLGARVPAGYVIAELENASERAVVLQAQGAYEAALASRSIALLEASNTGNSLEEAELSARDAYRSAYTTVDNTLELYVDTMLEGSDRVGGIDNDIRQERQVIWQLMREWRASLDEVETTNTELLIARAEENTRRVSEFLAEFARQVNDSDSTATATQRSNIATARTTITTLLSTLSAEREALRAAETASQVADRQTNSSSSATASADASVKQALGSLRLAQASL